MGSFIAIGSLAHQAAYRIRSDDIGVKTRSNEINIEPQVGGVSKNVWEFDCLDDSIRSHPSRTYSDGSYSSKSDSCPSYSSDPLSSQSSTPYAPLPVVDGENKDEDQDQEKDIRDIDVTAEREGTSVSPRYLQAQIKEALDRQKSAVARIIEKHDKDIAQIKEYQGKLEWNIAARKIEMKDQRERIQVLDRKLHEIDSIRISELFDTVERIESRLS